MMNKDLGLYIHIPFCEKKCAYCDFLSSPADEETKESYFNALLKEIKSYRTRTRGYTVPTIFIGGGTPSCFPASYIQRILEEIRQAFSVEEDRLEATIEANPGTLTMEKLKTYRNAGINRISIGLQSADNKELILLGRIHTYEQFRENYFLAREAGFQNINIDLMSALPGQTLNSWENTLYRITELNPEHISAYSLIVEEGTPFYDQFGEHGKRVNELPDEDTDRLMYHKTKEILQNQGYHRYEISNYAKPGYESRHNCSYWIGTQYLGLGLGASSLLNGVRIKNTQDLKQYIKNCEHNGIGNRNNANRAEEQIEIGVDNREENRNKVKNKNSIENQAEIETINQDYLGIQEEYQRLSKKEQIEEFMFLGLRMCKGVSKTDFRKRFYVNMEEVYPELLERLEREKLVKSDKNRIWLTEYGIDISNMIFSEFLLD